MPDVRILPRSQKETIADVIASGLSGFQKGRKTRFEREKNDLTRQKTLAEIGALKRQSKMFDQFGGNGDNDYEIASFDSNGKISYKPKPIYARGPNQQQSSQGPQAPAQEPQVSAQVPKISTRQAGLPLQGNMTGPTLPLQNDQPTAVKEPSNNIPPQFVEVMETKVDDMGRQHQVPKLVQNEDYKNYMELKQMEQKGALESGMKTENAMIATMRSADKVSSAANRFAELWAQAYEEGGVGNAAKELWANANIRWGGDAGDKFRKTSAMPGRKTEMVSAMMPVLTQQGEDKGSVRLVERIFAKLEMTLPKGYSGPGAAYDQLGTTIENMYGFAKAYWQTGVIKSQIDAMSDEELDAFVQSLQTASARITFSDEEKQSIDGVITNALQPIGSILEDKKKGDGQLMVDANGNRAMVYPDGSFKEIN